MPAIDVDAYRKDYEQRLNKAAATAEVGSVRPAAAEAAADDLAATVAELIDAASNRKQRVGERLSALRELGALEFLGPRFSSFMADYVALLRSLATDPSVTIRRVALENLALKKDPEGRELLIRGLEKPADALVSEAIALQFLGYDDHGEIVPLARKIYRRSKGKAREEALRILATDPESEPTFKRLLNDKEEASSIRRLSATALRDLNPAAFEKAARRIVVDDSEFNEIRSTSLTGLSQQAADSPADAKLVEQVAALHQRARSPAVKSSSARFLDAHGVDPAS